MTFEEYKEKYKHDRFYREVFIDEIYKPVFNKKKDIVLDIGALAGEFSFWIKGDVVYAIEPEHEHYQELIQNKSSLGLDNIKSFKMAIAGENEIRTLYVGERGGGVLRGEKGEQVSAVTLATFIKANKIPFVDILKIDVERAEGEIFNAPDFKDVVDKIGCIIGEHLDEVRALLIGYGFKTVTETPGSNLLFER